MSQTSKAEWDKWIQYSISWWHNHIQRNWRHFETQQFERPSQGGYGDKKNQKKKKKWTIFRDHIAVGNLGITFQRCLGIVVWDGSSHWGWEMGFSGRVKGNTDTTSRKVSKSKNVLLHLKWNEPINQNKDVRSSPKKGRWLLDQIRLY